MTMKQPYVRHEHLLPVSARVVACVHCGHLHEFGPVQVERATGGAIIRKYEPRPTICRQCGKPMEK